MIAHSTIRQLLRGLALAGLGTACAGADADPIDPGPGTPPPATHSATGAVYPRSDAVAYAADFTPASGLGGAAVTFGSATGASDGAGAFALATTTQPAYDHLPLRVTMAGYQPTWIPWMPAETGKPVPIALYPEVAVTARPGFVKGVFGADAGGTLPAHFAHPAGFPASTIVRARDVVGANLFAYADFLRVSALDVGAGTITMGPPPWGGTTRAMYETMVAAAKSKGMQFLMAVSIFNGPAVSFAPLYSLSLTHPLWDAIFAGYRSFVQDRAAIARDLGVEYLGFGGSIGFLGRHDPARWRDLISAVRAVGYNGKIGHFSQVATTREFIELHDAQPGFVQLFDYLGVAVGPGIWPETKGATLGKAYSRARMRADLQIVFGKLSAYSVPLFIQLGTPSVHGGVSTEEHIESCVTGCVSVAPLRTRDYYQQADLYQAAAEVINQSPTGSGVMGLLTWGYNWVDDLTGTGPWTGTASTVYNTAYDKSSNARGKPAEAVLAWWFQRW